MKAIHIKAKEVASKWGSVVVEATLAGVTGVMRVVVVKSSGLVSVLYDEQRTTAEQILEALRNAGFDAAPCSLAT
jgi:copper chaperone CopZ